MTMCIAWTWYRRVFEPILLPLSPWPVADYNFSRQVTDGSLTVARWLQHAVHWIIGALPVVLGVWFGMDLWWWAPALVLLAFHLFYWVRGTYKLDPLDWCSDSLCALSGSLLAAGHWTGAAITFVLYLLTAPYATP